MTDEARGLCGFCWRHLPLSCLVSKAGSKHKICQTCKAKQKAMGEKSTPARKD